ncbi:hypothetical protein [Streptomyces sp. NPDC046685]|uniref:hypothetical protein n=1 Tax=Streptomyces sp. NPDC046685 TaxID=3157202 RepID=UPI00341139AF
MVFRVELVGEGRVADGQGAPQESADVPVQAQPCTVAVLDEEGGPQWFPGGGVGLDEGEQRQFVLTVEVAELAQAGLVPEFRQ